MKNRDQDPLDFAQRRAVSHRWEISPYGGDYFGDKLNHSFIVGGDLQYNWTPSLGTAIDFGYSRAGVDRTSTLGAVFTNRHEYLADGSLVFTVPAAYRGRKGAVEADFFTSIGGGILRINNSNRGGGFIGGGMKIRTRAKWFAIRIEIRNYFTSINNPSGSDFEDDLTVRIGPTFLLLPSP